MTRAAALLLAGALALAAPAAGQVRVEMGAATVGGGADPAVVAAPDAQFGRIDDLAIEVRTGWPKALDKGWFPVFVELLNESEDREEIVSVEIEKRGLDWSSEYLTDGAARLAPGERRVLELLVPAFEVRQVGYRFNTGSASVVVRSVRTGKAHHSSIQLEPTQGRVLPMLLVGGAGGLDAQAFGERMVAGGKLLVPQPQEEQAPRPHLAATTAERLPTRLEAYTSLEAVVVSAADPPTELQLEPAIAWARLGGTLAFVGPGAEEAARSYPAVRAWTEERFRREGFSPATVWRMGHGRVVVIPSDDDAAADALMTIVHELPSREPRATRSVWSRLPEIPGLGRLPFRAFALLMVAFAVLVGPVNFILLKRLGRNGLLLLTIPGLAACVSAVFLAYGTFHQGVDVKRAEHSLSLLDQRSHRASTVSARQVFAGFAPSGGLHPSPGTVVLPFQERDRLEGIYTLDLRGEVRLAGDYIPARRPVLQALLSDRPARSRVDLVHEDGVWTAKSSLTERIETFVFRAEDGCYGTQSAIPPGGTARLRPMDEAIGANLLHEAARRGLWETRRPMLAGTFVARLNKNPLVDDCGLDSTEYDGWHLLVGVTDLAGGEEGR